MTDVNFAAADTPAAASTFSGQALSLPGWTSPGQDRLVERERLMDHARGTDAAQQLQRCFPRWMKAFDHLAWRALVRWLATSRSIPTTRTSGRAATSRPRRFCAATDSPPSRPGG